MASHRNPNFPRVRSDPLPSVRTGVARRGLVTSPGGQEEVCLLRSCNEALATSSQSGFRSRPHQTQTSSHPQDSLALKPLNPSRRHPILRSGDPDSPYSHPCSPRSRSRISEISIELSHNNTNRKNLHIPAPLNLPTPPNSLPVNSPPSCPTTASQVPHKQNRLGRSQSERYKYGHKHPRYLSPPATSYLASFASTSTFSRGTSLPPKLTRTRAYTHSSIPVRIPNTATPTPTISSTFASPSAKDKIPVRTPSLLRSPSITTRARPTLAMSIHMPAHTSTSHFSPSPSSSRSSVTSSERRGREPRVDKERERKRDSVRDCQERRGRERGYSESTSMSERMLRDTLRRAEEGERARATRTQKVPDRLQSTLSSGSAYAKGLGECEDEDGCGWGVFAQQQQMRLSHSRSGSDASSASGSGSAYGYGYGGGLRDDSPSPMSRVAIRRSATSPVGERFRVNVVEQRTRVLSERGLEGRASGANKGRERERETPHGAVLRSRLEGVLRAADSASIPSPNNTSQEREEDSSPSTSWIPSRLASVSPPSVASSPSKEPSSMAILSTSPSASRIPTSVRSSLRLDSTSTSTVAKSNLDRSNSARSRKRMSCDYNQLYERTPRVAGPTQQQPKQLPTPSSSHPTTPARGVVALSLTSLALDEGKGKELREGADGGGGGIGNEMLTPPPTPPSYPYDSREDLVRDRDEQRNTSAVEPQTGQHVSVSVSPRAAPPQTPGKHTHSTSTCTSPGLNAFDAEHAAYVCRRMEGYVSFRNVEGLGTPFGDEDDYEDERVGEEGKGWGRMLKGLFGVNARG